MSRRGRWAAVGAVVVLVVVIGAAAFVTIGPGGSSGSAHRAPHYTEETATAGLVHTFDGGLTSLTGGGVAVFDCDGDGRPDVYLAGGDHPAELFRNESPVGGALRFARVDGSGTDLDAVTGAYPIDIDADGVADLAVLRVGGTQLLRGLGDCRFEPADEAWGVVAQPRVDDGVLGHVGRGATRCRPSRSGTTSRSTTRAR